MAAEKGNCYNPSGRPRKEINWEIFESLCDIQCTQCEIASALKVDLVTLMNHAKEHYNEDFSILYKRFTEQGRSSLRRTQYRLSETNAAMAIWLGKQYLGQKEPEKEQPIGLLTPDDLKNLAALIASQNNIKN